MNETMTENTTEDPLLTVEEVARLLNVRINYVYEQASAGNIPRIKMGKYVRFRRSAIDTFLAERER